MKALGQKSERSNAHVLIEIAEPICKFAPSTSISQMETALGWETAPSQGCLTPSSLFYMLDESIGKLACDALSYFM